MDTLQAVSIIDKVRDENSFGQNFGLLEMLEIMTDEYSSGGHEYFKEVYTSEERLAYHTLMDGFREFFHGKAA